MKLREFKKKLLSFISFSLFLIFVNCEDGSIIKINKSLQYRDDVVKGVKDSRGLFSPRMDYEQWKPLGRGDPLKNDPTYDYVPPVLDRVHYWIDPASRKPDSPHPSEMKKTEILVLGVSSKKPSTGFSTIPDLKRDSYDPFVKYIENPGFNFHQRLHRPQYSMPQFYSFYKKPEQKEPYTMLVPPPLVSGQELTNYQQTIMSSTSTTTPVPMSSTTLNLKNFEESNLIYQSSSHSTSDSWSGGNTYATLVQSSSQTPTSTPNDTQNQKQLPLARPPEEFKEVSSFSIVPSVQTSSMMKNIGADVIVSSPEMTMHKGQVTDDTLDLSSTYVNIGKTDAQMLKSTGLGIDVIPLQKRPGMLNSPLMSSIEKLRKSPPPPSKKPLTLQTIQTIQPLLSSSSNRIQQKKPLLYSLLRQETTTATTTTEKSTSTTTLSPSLTTDPLFKHYKQPVELVRGPLYLIIQGHSKVKTYGPSKQINGISVQETNEILTSEDKQTGYRHQVKHLHTHERMKDREKRASRSGRLQTLNHVVVTGFGALPENRQQLDPDVKETELVVKYDVAKEATSEVYHKGIVESEVPPNRPPSVRLKLN